MTSEADAVRALVQETWPDDSDGDVLVGQFTITCARLDGEWKVACSHHSVI